MEFAAHCRAKPANHVLVLRPRTRAAEGFIVKNALNDAASKTFRSL